MTTLFLVLAISCLVAGFSVEFLPVRRRSQRRLYWASACFSAIFGFVVGYPNWKSGLGIAGILFAGMIIAAYAATPYIKIGGKIYALTTSQRQPDPEDAPAAENANTCTDDGSAVQTADPDFNPVPDSYSGMLTPATMWWLLVVLAVIVAVNAYAYLFSDGKAGAAAVGTGLFALLALGAGYGDASWGYRIARGQYVPFTLVCVSSAGVFALVYLAAYATARRWPLRRTQSMEYRAHPSRRKPEA